MVEYESDGDAGVRHLQGEHAVPNRALAAVFRAYAILVGLDHGEPAVLDAPGPGGFRFTVLPAHVRPVGPKIEGGALDLRLDQRGEEARVPDRRFRIDLVNADSRGGCGRRCRDQRL